jgi:hypothetical protein
MKKLLTLCICLTITIQIASQEFTEQVKAFISVDTTFVAITNVTIINGNLQTDIKNIRNMEIIFKDGVGFDSKKLFESVKGKVGLN